MKTPKLLIGLLGGITVCGSYLLWDSMHKKQEFADKETKAQLMLVNYDQVEELFIQKKGMPAILVKRSPDGWKLESPIKDNADSEAVEQFIKDIYPERASEVLPSGEAQTFGFAPEAGMIKVTTSGKESETYTISSLRNFESQTYLKRNSEKEIYVVSSQWLDRLAKQPDELQDRRFLRMAPAKIHGIHIAVVAGPEINLTSKVAGEWSIESSKGLGITQKVDPKRLLGFQQALSEAKAVHILTADEKVPALKKLAILEVSGSDTKVTFDISQAEDKKVYAINKTSGQILKMGPGTLDIFIRFNAAYLEKSDKPVDKNKADLEKAMEKLELKGVIPNQENYESKKEIK